MRIRPAKHFEKPEKSGSKPTETKASSITGLRVIAGFKLLQGFLLALVGTGLLFFINKDVSGQMSHLIATWQIDTDNNFVRQMLGELDTISPLKFKGLTAGAFIYAALLGCEGTGLLLNKRWAEYLTVVLTGSFLPWELFEVVHRFNLVALIIFIANGAVVWYLVKALREKHEKPVDLQGSN